MSEKPGGLAAKLVPAAADAAAVLLYIFYLPRMTAILQKKSLINIVLVGGIYLLFCFSVWLIRKQPVFPEKKADPGGGSLGFFGVMFGIFVIFMMADSGGLIERLENLPGTIDGSTALAVLAVTLIGLGLAFLYMIILIVKVRPGNGDGSHKIRSAEVVSLLGIQAMSLVSMAYWHAAFSGVEPYEDLAAGGKILIFLATYTFFMLFFAPPRMLFLLRRPGGIAVASFILQTAYFVWDFLSGTAW